MNRKINAKAARAALASFAPTYANGPITANQVKCLVRLTGSPSNVVLSHMSVVFGENLLPSKYMADLVIKHINGQIDLSVAPAVRYCRDEPKIIAQPVSSGSSKMTRSERAALKAGFVPVSVLPTRSSF